MKILLNTLNNLSLEAGAVFTALALILLFRLIKKREIKRYLKNFKSMNIADSESKLSIRGFYTSLLTKSYKVIVKSPLPSSDSIIDRDKVLSFIKSGYKINEIIRKPNKLVFKFSKLIKVSHFNLKKNKTKKGKLNLGLSLSSNKYVYADIWHMLITGISGTGKTNLINNLLKQLM